MRSHTRSAHYGWLPMNNHVAGAGRAVEEKTVGRCWLTLTVEGQGERQQTQRQVGGRLTGGRLGRAQEGMAGEGKCSFHRLSIDSPLTVWHFAQCDKGKTDRHTIESSDKLTMSPFNDFNSIWTTSFPISRTSLTLISAGPLTTRQALVVCVFPSLVL
jgi:hypothetical protein